MMASEIDDSRVRIYFGAAIGGKSERVIEIYIAKNLSTTRRLSNDLILGSFESANTIPSPSTKNTNLHCPCDSPNMIEKKQLTVPDQTRKRENISKSKLHGPCHLNNLIREKAPSSTLNEKND